MTDEWLDGWKDQGSVATQCVQVHTHLAVTGAMVNIHLLSPYYECVYATSL